VLIVSLMDLALMGRITVDYLLTGLVAAGIVAPASLILLSTLLHEVAQQQRRQMSTSVERAEASLRVALDSSDEGVLMVAADGTVLSANKRFFELWQVPPALATTGRDDLLLGHVLGQLVDPDGFMEGVRRLYSSEEQASDTLQFKDGRVFERYTRALTMGAEHGRIWCFRDVSAQTQARRALAEREEHYRAIVNQAGDGIDLVDAQTLCFLEVNQAACDMLGYRRDELVGRSLATIHGDLNEAGLRKIVAEVVRDGDASIEVRHRCKDGRNIDVYIGIRAIQLHGRTCLVGVWRDIGERKEAERNLKMAVEVTQVVFWKLDLLNQKLYFDQTNLQILGLDPSEALSSLPDWMARLHPDDAGPFGQRFEAALQAGDAVFDMEYRLRRIDGQYQWIHTRGSIVRRAADGRPELAVGTSMNISERKRTEAELERHRQHLEELVQQRTTELLATEARATRILDSAADGLYGVDSESRIMFINRAACRMLGYTAQQVIGKSAHELFHHSRPDGSPYPAADCQARQAWRLGQESRVDDETYWHADGHPIPVALASHPMVENGRITGAVVSVVDVSLQRAATLAREQALAAAENLARARSEFVANMSHEIRTPMNGVLGFAKIGLRRYDEPKRARDAFEKILSSGNQLVGVVNEILDFSKIDAGKLQLERTEVSVNEVLNGALQLVTDRAAAKGLALRLERDADLPPTCMGDPLRIGQVLLNLLTNAIKFTEVGSVTLSAERQGEQLVFRVADTGIGMTAEQLDYVFNPFQQADGSITRKFGGTGLGLAICKRLLELMHGEVHVDSSPGRGSRFEVRLPFVPPAPKAAANGLASARPVERALAGLSVLLVEDDPINRAMLELELIDAGARLVVVGDGAQAVERVVVDGASTYDAVLMDIQMPVMDGHEATRRILTFAPGLPIIGQTAHAFDEDRKKCLAAGMVGYVTKPIDPQALVELVLQVVKARPTA
jgi:PAS domain S-box-containing protein